MKYTIYTGFIFSMLPDTEAKNWGEGGGGGGGICPSVLENMGKVHLVFIVQLHRNVKCYL